MKIFLILLSVVSAILLIVVILLQQGKGADLGSAFGRGAQGGLLTSTGKANFLTRITSGLVTIFLLSSLALSVYLGNSQQDEIFENLSGDSSQQIPAEEEVEIIGSEEAGGSEEIPLPQANDNTTQTPN